ncbi:MAG: hypothetical protein V2J26_06460 [Pacificimonas sp.]|nr:hypothetical protein [Pacificimonas sp.]
MKALAMRAARRAPEPQAEEAFRAIKAFIDSGTALRGPNLELLIAELDEAFAALATSDTPSLCDVLATVAGRAERVAPQALIAFFAPYEGSTEYVAKNLRTATVAAPPGDAPQPFAALASGNHIAQVMGIAALMFGQRGDDITPVDQRFIEKEHFSFIRRSTGPLSKLVVHGLRFAPHADHPQYTYFSEKYERHDDTGTETGRRESNGVGFFDQDFVYGICRTLYRHTMTYFVGQRPNVDDFVCFDALLMTSNTSGARVAARGLCLAHRDEQAKQALTGVRSPDEVRAGLSRPAHLTGFDGWLATPDRQGIIVL